MSVSFVLVSGCCAGDGWFLAAAVGLAFDGELVGGGGEAVDDGGEEGVGHHGKPVGVDYSSVLVRLRMSGFVEGAAEPVPSADIEGRDLLMAGHRPG